MCSSAKPEERQEDLAFKIRSPYATFLLINDHYMFKTISYLFLLQNISGPDARPVRAHRAERLMYLAHICTYLYTTQD